MGETGNRLTHYFFAMNAVNEGLLLPHPDTAWC